MLRVQGALPTASSEETSSYTHTGARTPRPHFAPSRILPLDNNPIGNHTNICIKDID